MNRAIQRLITLAVTLVATAMVFGQDAKEEATQYPEVEKFVGIWQGEFKRATGDIIHSFPVTLEIEQRQGREILITKKWATFQNKQSSGIGVVTPNSASWVLLNGKFGQFGRFLAKISENGQMVGEYFRGDTLENTGNLRLDRVNLGEHEELLHRIESEISKCDYFFRHSSSVPWHKTHRIVSGAPPDHCGEGILFLRRQQDSKLRTDSSKRRVPKVHSTSPRSFFFLP